MNRESNISILSKIALNISGFTREQFFDLKNSLGKQKQCKSLEFMFDNVDRFMFYLKNNGRICIYFDTNGFNGFTKEDPIYLPRKKYVSFNEFKDILKLTYPL